MSHLSTLLVGILFLSPFAWAEQDLQTELTAPTSEQTLQLLSSVQQLVDDYYVDEVDKQQLLDGALKGMLEVLDPHSSYLRPQTLALLRDNNRGHYYGYGLEVAVEEGQIRIITPLDGSSAAAAGVLPGDVLLQVDELTASADNLDPLIAYIKQASLNDRSLKLVLQRPNATEPIQFQVAPSAIDIATSASRLLAQEVGYLKISSFNSRTAFEVRLAARQLQQQQLKGLVLDLRNNPGGLLDSAVQIADMFLSQGTIVTTHGRFFDANSDYHATEYNLFGDLPVVVLINQGSASAAEIVAGALQDQGRAKLLGERSYGKGTVQSLIPLMGHGGAVKLTTARYATPNGTFIDQQGIKPDLPVALAAATEDDIVTNLSLSNQWTDDPQLFAAYDYLLNQ
ncbi:S41 family peptidase [uncultured Ferrimonas sp.]|uniref:S41 family peptidase n=1 Tax=uncultured Ferrimonas sp. TaxID=432640 RepID=UPI00261BED44|nr:S41 family peptidase [uncultured Ferrimonas sp.]